VPSNSIRLVEVFSSIQGEGVLVGRRQVFIRTYGCNLRCSYCDSPETLKESGTPKECRVEQAAGSWEFDRAANPISAEQLTKIVSRYLGDPHHSISITGGEPLLHAGFLANWLPEVRSLGLKVFLETNGLLAVHLKRVLHLLDYVSMDFKPPTATGVAAEATWSKHRDFLSVASKTNVYGKLVVTPSTKDSELDSVIDTIQTVDAGITLILQPVTPFGVESAPVSPARIVELHARAARRLQDVRVIPQMHKIMNVL
jgi:7-carboxy-7-deazaguanine synthase